MAEDVTIPGGKYAITIKDALSEADDAITGDMANIMNMALARGCWFQWEYTVQIELHMDEVEVDLLELGEMRKLYAELADWTPSMLLTPANLNEQLSQMIRWGVGSTFTNKVSVVTVDGVQGGFTWPPSRSLPNGTAIPSWEEVQANWGQYGLTPGEIRQTSDGVLFRYDVFGTGVFRVDPADIRVTAFTGPIMASDAEIARVRRELEAAIESKTQRGQEKQAQLQDLTAALQRWFTFTTNVNERKKRDADTIAGNFH